MKVLKKMSDKQKISDAVLGKIEKEILIDAKNLNPKVNHWCYNLPNNVTEIVDKNVLGDIVIPSLKKFVKKNSMNIPLISQILESVDVEVWTK